MSEANKAICELLAQIETIVNRTEAKAADLNSIFESINNNTASCGTLTDGQLVQNMRSEISKTRQHFAQYWPKR